VGPEVIHHRTVIMEHSDRIVRQVEQFFVARVSVAQRPLGDVAAMHVSDGIDGVRWWTLDELDATDEKVWPDGLPDLIRSLRS
jgi:hypothetical protein